MKNVVFFNHFHNGDIHLSRTFVKEIVKARPDLKFFYYHRNPKDLLFDIDISCSDFVRPISEHSLDTLVGDTLYLNTWYASGGYKFMNTYGITYNCLYHLFNYYCNKHFGFDLSAINNDKNYFFPDVDFSIMEYKQYIDNYMIHINDVKKIFVSNGNVLSGQADNFDMSCVINELGSMYPNYFIIYTNPANITSENCFYSKTLINKNGCDLNENGYLSTYCDVIIGRASGTYTFAVNKYNCLEKNKKFVCFCNLDNALWYKKEDFTINYSCDMIVENISSKDRILDICKKVIENEK